MAADVCWWGLDGCRCLPGASRAFLTAPGSWAVNEVDLGRHQSLAPLDIVLRRWMRCTTRHAPAWANRAMPTPSLGAEPAAVSSRCCPLTSPIFSARHAPPPQPDRDEGAGAVVATTEGPTGTVGRPPKRKSRAWSACCSPLPRPWLTTTKWGHAGHGPRNPRRWALLCTALCGWQGLSIGALRPTTVRWGVWGMRLPGPTRVLSLKDHTTGAWQG